MRASTRRRLRQHRGRCWHPQKDRRPYDPTRNVMTEDEFDELVGLALDGIPAPLAAAMDNVVFIVEDEPPGEQPGLLGLYEGVPLTERDSRYAAVLPDRITIFRGPLLR